MKFAIEQWALSVPMARQGSVERRIDQILQHVDRPGRRMSLLLIAGLAVATGLVTLVAPQARLSVDFTGPMLKRVSGVGINPTYPDLAMRDGVEGTATFRVSIDAAGKPTRIELADEQPSGYGIADSAREALETWQFDNPEKRARDSYYKVALRLK